MFVPGANKMKNSVNNDIVGLSSDKLDDSQITMTLFKYVASKKSAPVPTATVGKCNTLRKQVLQLSLFPDIYDKHRKLHHPGNVDFGNMD